MVLWSNKDNLVIEDNKLKLQKKSGEAQEIDTKDNKSIAESIVPKKSIIDKIPEFTKTLEISLTAYFGNKIPQEYKCKIPEAINNFETELKNAVSQGDIPKFLKERIFSSIEASGVIPRGFGWIMNNKK